LYNLIKFRKTLSKKKFHVEQSVYELAIIFLFGLIHGLGFSNYLEFILSTNETIFIPLFCFNSGLEIGQVIILTICLGVNQLVLKFNKIYTYWVFLQLSLVFLLSIYLTFNNLFN
jgi:hypothetical protein